MKNTVLARCLVILVASLGVFVRAHGQNGDAPQAAGSYACGACFSVDDSGVPLLIPLESTDVVLDVKPGLLEAEVIQTFTNRSEATLEATYRYPLPPGATLTSFEVRYRDRTLVSVVREKNAARVEYVAAKSEGRRAALLEREDPALFSTSVANFVPGETVQAVIRFIQPLDLRDDAVEVRFPMVTGTKYFPEGTAPGAEGASAPAPARASRRGMWAAGHVYAFDVEVSGLPVREVSSDSHRIHVVPTASDRVQVSLADEITIPDRDFVLRVARASSDAVAPVWVTQQTPTGTYGLLTLFPPVPAPGVAPRTPRDVLFLIDQSGSMEGDRLAYAKLGVAECLARLQPQDRFQIVRFSTGHYFYAGDWVGATAAEVARARTWVLELQVDGGTELQRALAASLDAFERNRRDHVLIVLTDGDVGDEKTLVTMVERKRGTTRVFPLGIGSAPNPFLITKLAQCGGGQARFIANDQLIARELAGLYATLDAPALVDVGIEFVDAAGGELGCQMFPETVPDVFFGCPVQAVVRFPTGSPGRVLLEGRIAGRTVACSLDLQPSPMRGTGLEKLFGSRMVDDLEDMLRRASTHDEKALVREELLQTALQFQLVTEQTSRVAVDRENITAPGVRMVSVYVPQAPVADQGVVDVAPDGAEIIVLSPFEVSSEADNGYMAAETLAGTRIRTELRDVGSCTQMVTREFLDDVGGRTLEDALPYVMDLHHQPAVGSGQDCGLLNNAPVATVVAAPTLDRIGTKSFGLAWTNMEQKRAYSRDRTELSLSVRDDGGATASIEAGRAIGRTMSGLGVLTWDRFDADQWTALADLRKDDSLGTLRLGAQWRELQDYARIRAASVSWSAQLTSGLQLDVAVTAHRLDRDDPYQFHLGSPDFQYDGLGFLNLDILTADTRAVQDGVVQASACYTIESFGARHRLSSGALWHRRDSAWVSDVDTAPYNGVADARRVEFADQMRFHDDWLVVTLQAGATRYGTPGQTETRRLASRGAFDAALRITQGLSLVGVWAHDATLAAVPTGTFALRGGGLLSVTSELESHRGGQLGLRLETLDGRITGQFGWFRDDVGGQNYRDWAWECEHAGSGPLWIDPTRVRQAVGTSTWRDYRRAGWMGAFDVYPIRALVATASWCLETRDEGPYQGGNYRASMLARYTFSEGWLRDLELGAGAAYRNAMTFDDGFVLRGGTRLDLLLGYTWRHDDGGGSRVQINWIDLADSGLQPTRFATERGSRLVLTFSREF